MFNLEKARADGIPDAEIASHLVETGQVEELAGLGGLNYRRMKQDGISDKEIVDHILDKGVQLPPPAPGSSVPGVLKAAGSGLVKGLIGGTVGAPGDMAQLGGTVAQWATGDKNPEGYKPPLPTSEDVLKRLPPMHKPMGAVERVVDAGATGAGSLVVGGPKNLLPRMGLGAFAGVLGEGAASVMDQNPLARAVGNVAGLVGGGYFGGGLGKPQIVKAVQKDLKETTPEQLRAAEAVAQKTQEVTGVRPALNQALPNKTALSGVSEEVMRSSAGDKLRQVFEKEGVTGREKIDALVSTISGRNPDQLMANEIAGAVQKAQERPMQVRGVLTKPLYDKAKREVIPAPDLPPMAAAVRNVSERNQFPAVSESGKAVEKVANQVEGLATNSPILDASGKPFQNPVPSANVQILKREAQTKAQAKADQGDSAAAASATANQGAAAALKNALVGTDAAAADAMHSRATRAIVEPSQKSALGAITDPGFAAGGPADPKAYLRVLQDDRFGPSDIRFVGENLRKAQPGTFSNMVKQDFMGVQGESFALKEGRTPQSALGEFATKVAGDTSTEAGRHVRETFKEKIRQVALDHGQDPVAAAKGAEELMNAMQVFARDRSSVGQISRTEMQIAAGRTAPTFAMRAANMIAPMQGMSRAIERRIQQHTYEKIAEALTSPGGVDTLINIAKYSYPRDMANQVARGLISVNTSAESAQ